MTPHGHDTILEIAETFRDLGPAGWLAFIALHTLFCTLLLPGSLLTLVAGAIYGWKIAALLVTSGSTLGAMANFLAIRCLGRPWFERRLHRRPQMASLANLISSRGWPFLLLSRCSLLMPHGMISCALGLTRMNLGAFAAASFVGFLPLNTAYALAGTALGHAVLLNPELPPPALPWPVLALSIAFTFAATLAFGHLTAHALGCPNPSLYRGIKH